MSDRKSPSGHFTLIVMKYEKHRHSASSFQDFSSRRTRALPTSVELTCARGTDAYNDDVEFIELSEGSAIALSRMSIRVSPSCRQRRSM